MSPTTTLLSGERHVGTGVDGWVGQGCTRGGGDWGGPGGVLYRVPDRTLQNHDYEGPGLRLAYLRPNEGNSMLYDEVSEIWSRMGPRMTPE